MRTKTESLRQSESEGRKELELGAGEVPVVPGNRDDEQVAVRHADASGGDITENQHEEDRMRDIQVSKRGSEAASEEQSDNLRKYYSSKRLRMHQHRPIHMFPWNILRVVRHNRPGCVFVQKSGHVDDDVQISALDPAYEMDGRKSRYIKEGLERY